MTLGITGVALGSGGVSGPLFHSSALAWRTGRVCPEVPPAQPQRAAIRLLQGRSRAGEAHGHRTASTGGSTACSDRSEDSQKYTLDTLGADFLGEQERHKDFQRH